MKKLSFFIGLLFLFSCGDDDAPSFDRDFIVDNVNGVYQLFSSTPDLNPNEVPDGLFQNGSLLETLNCSGNAIITFNSDGSFSIQSGPFNTMGVTVPECSNEENASLNESGIYFVQDDNPNIGLTGSNPTYLTFLQDIDINLSDEDFQNRKSLSFTVVGENPTTEMEFSLNYIFLSD